MASCISRVSGCSSSGKTCWISLMVIGLLAANRIASMMRLVFTSHSRSGPGGNFGLSRGASSRLSHWVVAANRAGNLLARLGGCTVLSTLSGCCATGGLSSLCQCKADSNRAGNRLARLHGYKAFSRISGCRTGLGLFLFALGLVGLASTTTSSTICSK